MRRSANEALLQQVANIRALQCLAAEARASRAAAELEEKNAVHCESERRRSDIEERWSASLVATVIQTEMLPLLSATYVAEEESVRAAAGDVERAEARLEERTVAWRTASMHRDNAQQLAREARKERMRRREEAAVQDAADRHAQHWSRR